MHLVIDDDITPAGRPMIMVESSLWRPHEYDIEEYQRMVCYFMSKAEVIMDQNQSDKVVVLFNMEGWQLSHAKYGHSYTSLRLNPLQTRSN